MVQIVHTCFERSHALFERSHALFERCNSAREVIDAIGNAVFEHLHVFAERSEFRVEIFFQRRVDRSRFYHITNLTGVMFMAMVETVGLELEMDHLLFLAHTPFDTQKKVKGRPFDSSSVFSYRPPLGGGGSLTGSWSSSGYI